MSRIATVFGATGVQGGSVIEALLEDGTFKIRAVTRDVSSESSKKLAARGVEVVAGDIGSLESIKKAISGSEVVFMVTIPNPVTFELDLVQGTRLIDAAKENGVRYIVWSSTLSVFDRSGGKYSNPSLDQKAQVDDVLRKSASVNARCSGTVITVP